MPGTKHIQFCKVDRLYHVLDEDIGTQKGKGPLKDSLLINDRELIPFQICLVSNAKFLSISIGPKRFILCSPCQ